MYRLGIDAGRTQTTAILMDPQDKIMAIVKEPVTTGLVAGIAQVLERMVGVDRSMPIEKIIIGTDFFGEALLAGKRLAKVAAIRIGQARSTIPPLYGGVGSVRSAIAVDEFFLYGGHEIDGRAHELEWQQDELKRYARACIERGVESFAITGTFSPLAQGHEAQVASWIREAAGDASAITMSHELGSLGFLERENAAILNASLTKLVQASLAGVKELIDRYHIQAKLFFTQNDGSLLSYDAVLRHPIRTFGSHISNCFRGASLLARLQDCVIVDVFEDAARIGLVEGGFPKEKRRNQNIAGVRVNLQMPDVTEVRFPSSGPVVRDECLEEIHQAIQRFQPRFDPYPIVFVGEKSERIAAVYKYPWVDVLHPQHFPLASTVGACMAPISGRVDRIFWLEEMSREETMDLAKQEAIHSAVREGADPQTVFVQTAEIFPLSYMPSKAVRVSVKAIGDALL
ncbi:hydantoinase [Brevibacillus fluminis]|uniref:Hydantoinase n=1 Tax=Brevibacillus fluminis TaxID=511487 RepID=A0A3M8DV28_9BACL|nr:hydantoinase/oxoprolinase N-terminal domain-containing protein [Brevibacillus fluminis]RNB92028.1 hydantoinase [Brevibacillus fluminis]